MRTHIIHPRYVSLSLILAAMVLVPAIGARSAQAVVVDPLANGPVDPDLFTPGRVAKLATHTAPVPPQPSQQDVGPADYQTNTEPPASDGTVQLLPAPAGAAAAPKDPCGAVENKPLNQLGISIAEPAGKLPTDLAAPCWAQINQTNGTAGARCWPVNSYNWDATCFYHNPLYFEEPNLERYGYNCGDACCCCSGCRECCLQPAASAAHFYGAVLALPYCMAEECPGDCVYTLGHYRPGSCNPWRCYWPTFDPVAALAAGGIWTGLIFAIP
jgi:hypothetical protein